MTNKNLPELMKFTDGTPVETLQQWQERRREILNLYETCMYGKMPDPDQEEVRYLLSAGDEDRIRKNCRTSNW